MAAPVEIMSLRRTPSGGKCPPRCARARSGHRHAERPPYTVTPPPARASHSWHTAWRHLACAPPSSLCPRPLCRRPCLRACVAWQARPRRPSTPPRFRDCGCNLREPAAPLAWLRGTSPAH
eukprot:7375817-Prymnesium_polylepis.2